MKHRKLLTQWHSITYQKTWIFTDTIIGYSVNTIIIILIITIPSHYMDAQQQIQIQEMQFIDP